MNDFHLSSEEGGYTVVRPHRGSISIVTPQKRYKLFLVEEDDDMRERVIAAVVESAIVDVDCDGDDYSYATNTSSSIHYRAGSYTATMTLKLVAGEDGTYMRIEDFSEEEE